MKTYPSLFSAQFLFLKTVFNQFRKYFISAKKIKCDFRKTLKPFWIRKHKEIRNKTAYDVCTLTKQEHISLLVFLLPVSTMLSHILFRKFAFLVFYSHAIPTIFHSLSQLQNLPMRCKSCFFCSKNCFYLTLKRIVPVMR